MTLKPITIICLCLFLFNISFSQSQQDSLFVGCVYSENKKNPIPHATIGSYSKVTLFVADDKGCFRLRLPPSDSIKITALGHESVVIVLNKLPIDSFQVINIELTEINYMLKEVTAKGYSGIFDPLIFPKHLNNENQINLNLPSNIGSKVSKLSPSERALIENRSLASLASPVSLIYSMVSKREKSIKNLTIAKQESAEWKYKQTVASKEIIESITHYSGQKLDDFIIYCNINLLISNSESILSVLEKIKKLMIVFEENYSQ
jgi:hypothetical protein